MDELKIKQFVAKKLHEGVKLSDIQNQLVEELDCKMTFLDLRLMAADLEDVDWHQFDPVEKKAPEAKAPAAPAAPAEGEAADAEAAPKAADAPQDAPAAGTTQVEVSRLARPGAMVHGTVKFASGATAEWLVDEMGQLGLDKVTGEPTQNDVMEFQKELQKLFSRR